jgi:pimeloyl-ACP methyl ester carboxylesterase
MQRLQRPTIGVVLPGTGSDAEFAHRAFAPVLSAVDTQILAIEPDPRRVVAGYIDALDDAASRFGSVLVGGISIGAAVALAWASSHPANTVAVLAALPPWTGEPDGAPAAMSASFTAGRLRADGLAAVTAEMQASSPPWLAATLTRSWKSQWPALPDALDEAASFRAPTRAELSDLDIPVGVVGAVDDPIHPIGVAEDWVNWLPRAGLTRITLDELGADPGVLGRATLSALADIGLYL